MAAVFGFRNGTEAAFRETAASGTLKERRTYEGPSDVVAVRGLLLSDDALLLWRPYGTGHGCHRQRERGLASDLRDCNSGHKASEQNVFQVK